MNSPQPVVARAERRFAASPECVFDALLDPDQARHFLFATPSGQMVAAEIDPRPGGRYRFVDRRAGEDVEHTGQYLDIERPHRLVFTFSVPKYAPGSDRVTVLIEPLPEGCTLSLRQDMKPEWAGFADRTAAGWASILDGLAATLRGQTP